MSTLTQDEYVSAHGLHCAYCQGTDMRFNTDEAEFDLGDVVVPVECENCGAQYLERYVIAGWEPLPKENEHE